MDRSGVAVNVEPLRNARLSADGTVKDVRGDHVARYRWAAAQLRGSVIDAGSNSGYGAAILADAGLSVLAVDAWAPGLDYAREHWPRPGIVYLQMDVQAELLPQCHAVVAFELIEHLERPERFLRAARAAAPLLLLSAPNEAVWPWQSRLAPVHHRHYRREELALLLSECGWRVTEWFGQRTGRSPVEPEVEGRTLVAVCR